jgi:hypothetical protein
MLRRRLALPALLGLLGLAWAGAHALAYDGGQGANGYLSFLPTSFALCLALALVLAGASALGKRWSGSPWCSLWLFGVVPVLGFALDTLIELPGRGEASLSGTAVVAAELLPVVAIGLLLQLPVALVAVGLASGLLRLVEGLAWALFAPRAPARHRATGRIRWARVTGTPVLHLAGTTHSRAPPAPAT